MICRIHVPGPPLSDFVDVLWLYQDYAPGHKKERVLPTGTTELVVNLRQDELRLYDREEPDRFQRFRGSVVAGTHSELFVIDTEQQASIIGVHFKPGGAFPFLGVPAGELSNTHLSLDTLWGARAVDLRDALLEAPCPDAQFRILETCLLRSVTRPLARHRAVAFALDEFSRVPHTRTVAQVTERVGLSARRFIEVFRQEVGLTPKVYCRIRRFQEVLGRLEQEEVIDWAQVALACGYFDQAHLIRDFKAFSGLNPSAYLEKRGPHRNHVPLEN